MKITIKGQSLETVEDLKQKSLSEFWFYGLSIQYSDLVVHVSVIDSSASFSTITFDTLDIYFSSVI